MRIVLILLMCWGVAFGQDTTKYFKSVDYGWNWQRGKFRGGLILPTDTTNNKLGIAQIGATCFAWSGTKWSSIGSTDTSFLVRYYRKNQVDSAILANTPAEFDTTSLSNRINTKLNITDTTNKWVASVSSLNDSTIRVIKGTSTTDITIKSSATVTNATRLITTVYNKSGSTITKGSVVYINGAHSSILPSIALAKANTESTSAYTYGLVENDITNNNSGTVIQSGLITNLNLPTATYTDGQTLYLSPTVAGGYTLTKPTAPNHYVAIGTITRAHSTFGTIQIAIRNGFQLDEMSDVSIAVVPQDSTLLQFSRTDSLWHDVSVFNAIGNKYLKPTDTASLSTRINTKLNTTTAASTYAPISINGTVTSVTLGRGITGSSPITSTGTIGLDTTKNYTWTGVNTFSPSVTASGAIGRGITITPTITASATNDTLVGVELSPTYNTSGFSGTQSIVRMRNGNMVLGANTYQLNSTNSTPKLYVNGNTYLYGATEITTNDNTYGFRFTATATETNMQDRAARGNSLMYIGSTSSSVYMGNYGSNPLRLITDNTTRMTILGTSGNVGIGITPTATLHLRAGTASASSAPLKFTIGTNLTTVENGAVEYDGTDYFASANSTRYTIDKTLRASATLDFASTAASTSTDLTITVTGAALNDIVSFGVPNGAVNANSCYTAWVSATNTVTIRFNNYQTIGAIDPASGTFKVSVIK